MPTGLNCRRIWRSRGGFTLLELLVGLTLWMLIAITLAGVFRGGLRLWKRAEELSPMRQEARGVLSQIAREYRNSIDVPGVGWTAQDGAVVFATLQGGKILEVAYRSGTAGRLVYARQELSPSGPIEPAVIPLTQYPAQLHWEYAVESGGGLVWRSRAEETVAGTMPTGVRVRLTLSDGQGEIETFTKTLISPTAISVPWYR